MCYFHRTSQLEPRIISQYPELIFNRPKRRTESEVVHSTSANLSDVVGDLPESSDETEKTTDTSDESVQDVNLDLPEETDDRATPARRSPRSITPGQMQIANSNVYYACRDLSTAIADHKYQPSLPPSTQNLTLEEAEKAVPPLLYNFLASMCGEADDDIQIDESQFCKLTPHSHSKVLSIAQDIIHLSSNGRKRTPKSMSLAITMKHPTGSAHIIRLLNGLGHCSSYDSVNRAETAIASNKLENPITIPPGFQKNILSVLVFDNIDYTEETLSGAGTTHQVNGIMYQRQVVGLSPTEDSSSNPVSRRERTIDPPTLVLDQFILGRRQGIPIQPSPSTEVRITDSEVVCRYQQQELIYLIAKKDQADLLPTWTGYQKMVTPEENMLRKSHLHYLDVIEAPPNDLSTIKHVLDMSVKKADELELEAIVVIFDQALYSKAQHIRWKDGDLQRRLVLRMGEFHTCMAFMGAIGKMFRLSGIEDVLVEAGVVADGSINGVISGHNYNRSLRAHKILYEAMSRLQIDCFVSSLDDLAAEAFRNVAKEIREVNTTNVVSLQMIEIEKRYAEFVSARSAESAMFKFWSSYQEAIRTLLMFIRATRESNWDAHVTILRKMIPYFFALDRQNYAR